MLIKYIQIENWRSFYGENNFLVSVDPVKNVTLIRAENGVGKTSQPAQLLVSDYTQQGAMSPKMKKIGMLFNSAGSHPAVNALSNLGFVFTLLPDED